MPVFRPFDNRLLNQAGLNRQAVFNYRDLPADIAAALSPASPSKPAYRQLILVGHAGRKLWECVKRAGGDSNDPIDDFTVRTLKDWFAALGENIPWEILYPGSQAIGLQRLGQLAGWHPRVRQFEAKKGDFWRMGHVAMRVSGRFSKKSCSGTFV